MTHCWRKNILFFTLSVCLLSQNFFAADSSDPKIEVDLTKEIVFGQSGAFSGHFKIYGETIKSAILACFERVNHQGGIHGKKLRFISLDDGSDVDRTKKNVDLLYKKYGITMFLGIMGSRSIVSLLPLVKQKKISLFFPWGGDPKLKDASLTNLVRCFGFEDAQTDALIQRIVYELLMKKIAIFYADDDYSTTNALSMADKLRKLGISPVALESYNRFTMNIRKTTKKFVEKDPRIVICFGTNTPVIKLINYLFEEGNFNTRFFGIEAPFLVPSILQRKGVSFECTSIAPNPLTSSIPLTKEYCDDLATYCPDADPSSFSFAFYIGARIIVEAMKMIPGEITQEHILEKISSMHNFDLNGFPINFNPSDHGVFGQKIWII